jgi:putative transposase
LRHLVSGYLAHYNEERPPQAMDNVPLGDAPPGDEANLLSLAGVRCTERLGGLLKHYYRPAA